jgi:hypothetical protein
MAMSGFEGAFKFRTPPHWAGRAMADMLAASLTKVARFVCRPAHVLFVVYNVALRQDFSLQFGFPLHLSFYQHYVIFAADINLQ